MIDLPSIVLWMTAGLPGAAWFWGVLALVALLEAAYPGRSGNGQAGPRLVVNFGLGLIAALATFIPALSAIVLAGIAKSEGWGLLNNASLPVWTAIVFSFLAVDFIAYAFHRASHRFHPLWRLHRVHHSDNDLDLSTLFRIHPLTVLLLVLVDGAAIFLLGLHPAGIAMHVLAKHVTMTLGHADTALRDNSGGPLSRLLVTPGFHARHHSADAAETGSNYGEVLSLWDRLLGSASPERGPVARFGLGRAYDADAASLRGQLRLPFIDR
ncbi:sterol desaturase family protein [Novosphingobium sp. MW5]|nr:sterol desaturase family protein [Novosphingobium sp. MW5]